MLPLAASRTSLASLAAGAALVFSPASFFAPLTSAPWEVTVLRFAGLLVPLAGTMWPWAARYGGASERRMRRWSGATVVSAILFVVLQTSLFLLLAFCLLAGSVADLATERADLAATQLRNRLQRDADR